jgi:hypothetical protein
MKSFFENYVFSHYTLYIHNLIDNSIDSFEHLVSTLSGTVYLQLQHSKQPILSFYGKNVQSFTWIPNWAVGTIHLSNNFQLDASFRSLKPYVFTVLMGLISNCALPTCLHFTFSENIEHYDKLFKAFQLPGLDLPVFAEKTFLTDQSQAIKHVLSKITHFHFLCYRHILESFGSHSFAAIIAHRILFTSSLGELENKLPQIFQDIIELINQNLITEKQIQRLCELFQFKYTDNMLELKGETANHDQALWIRSPFGCSTCSNHAERFHKSCNSRTRGIRSIIIRIFKIIELINEKFASYNPTNRSAAERFLDELKKKADLHNIKSSDICAHEDCHWGEIYSNLHGCPGFPCIHTAKKVNVTFPPLPEIPVSDYPCRIIICDKNFKPIDCPLDTNRISFDTDEANDDELIEPEDEEIDDLESIAIPSDDAQTFSGFIKEITAEVLKLHRLPKRVFQDIAMELSMIWGSEYGTSPEEVNEAERAKFRIQCWRMEQFNCI